MVPVGGAGIVEDLAAIPTFGADLLNVGWRDVTTRWAASDVGRACLARVAERSLTVKVYPPPSTVLDALKFTPMETVKVVIIGQDPYNGEGQAHGLSFSVSPGNVLPPSLRNIRREMLTDLGVGDTAWPSSVGCLIPWARQGVLMLNSVLTVETKNTDSHAGIGWEELTGKLLEAVVCARTAAPLVIIAWGRKAQNIAYKLSLGPQHIVIASSHPNPLSANSGFFGSKPFSRTNTFLEDKKESPILWNLQMTLSCEDPE